MGLINFLFGDKTIEPLEGGDVNVPSMIAGAIDDYFVRKSISDFVAAEGLCIGVRSVSPKEVSVVWFFAIAPKESTARVLSTIKQFAVLENVPEYREFRGRYLSAQRLDTLKDKMRNGGSQHLSGPRSMDLFLGNIHMHVDFLALDICRKLKEVDQNELQISLL